MTPQPIRRLALRPHLNRRLLRHGLCSRETHRARKRRSHRQQHHGPRNTLSPRHRGQPHRPGRIHLRIPGFVRTAQGGQPEERHADGDLIVVSIPIAFVNELNSIAALVLVRGADFLSIFEKAQRDALAMLFLNLHHYGYVVAEIFWGLWLFPLALLVYKSRFLPRFLGVWLALAGFAWVSLSLSGILLPQYQNKVDSFSQPAFFGEIAFMFWLLIIGAKPPAQTEK